MVRITAPASTTAPRDCEGPLSYTGVSLLRADIEVIDVDVLRVRHGAQPAPIRGRPVQLIPARRLTASRVLHVEHLHDRYTIAPSVHRSVGVAGGVANEHVLVFVP